KSQQRAAPAPAAHDKLRISIVGAGRVGAALGIALGRAGHEITLAVTKHTGSARRAANLIGSGCLGVTARNIGEVSSAKLLRQSRLILVTTPDDEIAEAAHEL